MMMAWHFVGARLRDGRRVPKDDQWLTHDGPLALCRSGLHASLRPWDALHYAPGNILCRVECAGEIIHGDDKLVCSRRRIVARMDATEMLRYFARMQAVSVLHLWDFELADVVLDYLMTGDESLRAATGDAAWAVARAAARDTARDAAVRAAAWAARAVAARDAARDAARAAARDDFDALVYECFGMGGRG
jgi:hypothetical protein